MKASEFGAIGVDIPEPLKSELLRPELNFQPGPREYLMEIGVDFDAEAQLRAIHTILKRNKEAESAHLREIDDAGEAAKRATGEANENLIGLYHGLIEESIFLDSANSMSAVGMLAPFLETVFT